MREKIDKKKMNMPTIKITIDGDEFSFTKTPTGVVFQFADNEPIEISNSIEEWADDVDGIFDEFIENGDEDRALFKTWLYYNAPYLEFIDEAPILALADEIVLHLADRIPGLPPPTQNIHLNIENHVLSRGPFQVPLPTTGTEALTFNSSVYLRLVEDN